ncbi:hypothetical protein SODALDRAFT_325727 [Sodiomyces alkalinus F11]|uniref:Uncharacterized protein n=1 Tax=Sodiomyces alkalinus (strain CBS 110278 / VKM F-3762 / F11) TaxID=1314773 RepID=A0A3N2PPL4_SODAK|nr:hypothetical protein SODALDRAFT_325727 [Sodiomyces alkalinus F11]ROT36380.1 hypothetical protein SODALDRAFT_325727 [Sodiomyces alkalinus F11]
MFLTQSADSLRRVAVVGAKTAKTGARLSPTADISQDLRVYLGISVPIRKKPAEASDGVLSRHQDIPGNFADLPFMEYNVLYTSTFDNAMTNPPSITFAPDAEPFEPKPLIADLLRTRFCIPGSIFLVESIESLPLLRSPRWRALRLLLGDGELCIQALLRPEMHRFVDLATIRLGCYVRLGHFQLYREEIAPRDADGATRSMVYLIVHDLDTVGWNMALVEPETIHLEDGLQESESDDAEVAVGPFDEKETTSTQEEQHLLIQEGRNVSSDASTHVQLKEGESMRESMRESMPPAQKPPEEEEDFIPDSDIDDLLDMADAVVCAQDERVEQPPSPGPGVENPVRPTEPESGRSDGQVGLRQGQGQGQGEVRDGDEGGTRQGHHDTKPAAAPRELNRPVHPPPRHPTLAPVALLRDWAHPSIPLKLTPLASIPHLPYKQNWSINVLAVVVALTDVEPFRFPPYTRRTARLVDPSTPKQVLLTVFLDPGEFCPVLGRPVLLVGVKNHLFDGGSLNKYASDRPPNSSVRWWYPDPSQLAWCEVGALVSWWRERGDAVEAG